MWIFILKLLKVLQHTHSNSAYLSTHRSGNCTCSWVSSMDLLLTWETRKMCCAEFRDSDWRAINQQLQSRWGIYWGSLSTQTCWCGQISLLFSGASEGTILVKHRLYRLQGVYFLKKATFLFVRNKGLIVLLTNWSWYFGKFHEKIWRGIRIEHHIEHL